MRHILTLIVFSFLWSCHSEKKEQKLKLGKYRAEFKINENEIIPFNFELKTPNLLNIYNAEEVIEVNDITFKNDSIYIKIPVFEGVIAAKIEKDKLVGEYIIKGKNRILPFRAEINATRFDVVNTNVNANISGNWETVFSPNKEFDKYVAKGIFKQNGNKITGTFRTKTGDYRYLEGVMDGNKMKLSTFDGAHAFLFTATVTDSTLNGMFYSGGHWKEPFYAKRNENFELPNANELTFLKEGYNSLEFTFPDSKDNQVSLSDDRFKNKVVIVQIMGTWCPNCLDETKYYSNFYKKNKSKGVEFVALAFEYAKTKEKAFKAIKRLQDRIDINYPILLAQFGTTSKTKAQEKLPMLNHVLSYPTSVFIDKEGKVRKIHTGFNGPATGNKYIEFKAEFENYIDSLLSE